jgi:hypothetical protein
LHGLGVDGLRETIEQGFVIFDCRKIDIGVGEFFCSVLDLDNELVAGGKRYRVGDV